MARANEKRSSFLYARDLELSKGREVIVHGYDTSGEFVCRLEISSAGIAVYAGVKGKKKLCDDRWEKFVRRLESTQT